MQNSDCIVGSRIVVQFRMRSSIEWKWKCHFQWWRQVVARARVNWSDCGIWRNSFLRKLISPAECACEWRKRDKFMPLRNSIWGAHNQLVGLCKRLTAAWPNGHLGWLKKWNRTCTRSLTTHASASSLCIAIRSKCAVGCAMRGFSSRLFAWILFYFNVRSVDVVKPHQYG